MLEKIQEALTELVDVLLTNVSERVTATKYNLIVLLQLQLWHELMVLEQLNSCDITIETTILNIEHFMCSNWREETCMYIVKLVGIG